MSDDCFKEFLHINHLLGVISERVGVAKPEACSQLTAPLSSVFFFIKSLSL
jgi:hypothetical protein